MDWFGLVWFPDPKGGCKKLGLRECGWEPSVCPLEESAHLELKQVIGMKPKGSHVRYCLAPIVVSWLSEALLCSHCHRANRKPQGGGPELL